MDTDTYADLPAADRAYRAVKDAIVTGELPPLTIISANRVAERLGISRTPAREAFVRLEGEGLLDLIPRRGAMVLPMSRTEARDVLEVRHALEVSAVARLAQIVGRPNRLSIARRQLRVQQDCLSSGELNEFPAHDEEFHRALVIASGNEVATRMYETLGDRQRRMTYAAAMDPPRLEQMLDEHHRLFELALDGDVDGFAATHWDHLIGTHRAWLGDESLLQRPEFASGVSSLGRRRL